MQFDDAILAAHRLAAEGKGAEDHVIIAALANHIAFLEARLESLVTLCNMREDGVMVLSETTKNQFRALRNQVCQVSGVLDAQEAQIFELRKRVPPKKARPKPKGSSPVE